MHDINESGLNDVESEPESGPTIKNSNDRNSETIKSSSASVSSKTAATIEINSQASPNISDDGDYDGNHDHYRNRCCSQIFTNTKELNKINLKSSSSLWTVKRNITTSSSSILTRTMLMLSPLNADHASSLSKHTLRKAHSSPSLKIGDVALDNEYIDVGDGDDIDDESKHGAHSHPIDHAMEADLALDTNSPDSESSLLRQETCSIGFTAGGFGCAHYKRRAMFVTPCCNKFYNCRFCHDENESHHFDRKTLTELICSECKSRQKVQERCENCGVRFGKYTCLICNLFDDADKQQYHCNACGICRIGGAENFFHCEVCNMCLPIQLKIDGHRCVENISRSHCPVCLGDIHTSRIPCHIPDCGHLLHKLCFDQLLASGHYTCPTCQTSLIDMTALWDYLDEQAVRMPIPQKYENQRIHIFCNDCHQTSKTKFNFIGLKCMQCGAYNTTQDVKRRMSLVTDEPTSA